MTNAQPSSYPTTSDISSLMMDLGYLWSNEAQVYYDYGYELISRKSAEKIYDRLIGNKPYTQIIPDWKPLPTNQEER